MPIYEYRCTKCGNQVEVLQKVNDPPLQRCRLCRGKLDKLVSRTSFLLRGGGWFAEGYGKSKAEGSKTKDSSEKAEKTEKKEKKDAGSKTAGSSS